MSIRQASREYKVRERHVVSIMWGSGEFKMESGEYEKGQMVGAGEGSGEYKTGQGLV